MISRFNARSHARLESHHAHQCFLCWFRCGFPSTALAALGTTRTTSRRSVRSPAANAETRHKAYYTDQSTSMSHGTSRGPHGSWLPSAWNSGSTKLNIAPSELSRLIRAHSLWLALASGLWIIGPRVTILLWIAQEFPLFFTEALVVSIGDVDWTLAPTRGTKAKISLHSETASKAVCADHTP